MREQFEKLPEVAKRLDGIYWNAELNIYQTEYPILFNAVGFVNGALYAYKEQQKKIAQGGVFMGVEYNSLRGANEFLDQLEDISEWQPDWSQAPEWAEWWAVDQDNNGSGWFYETQPTMGECSWFIGRDGKVRRKRNDSYKGDWKDSLRKRP